MYPFKINSKIHLKWNKEFKDVGFDSLTYSNPHWFQDDIKDRWKEFKRNQSLSRLMYENTEDWSSSLKDNYK